MQICITSKGSSLNDQFDDRFGRAAFLLLIDPATNAVEAIANPGIQVNHGAGIAAAQCLLDKKVSKLITGHLGPNAEQVLSSGQVTAFQAHVDTVQAALDAYKAGSLQQMLPPVTGA